MALICVSAHEDVTSMTIYSAVMKGLERLLLADVLSKLDAENLVKLSVDRYVRLLVFHCRLINYISL